MFGSGRKPKVLAQVPVGPLVGEGPGALDRIGLRGYGALWLALADSGPVMVTGGDDRSGVALGMAASAAAAGRRVALIECDLARPSLGSTLGLAEAPGLAEYLSHEAEAPQILQAAVLAGPATGLAVAPLVCVVGGMATQLGSVLLSSDGFVHAVAKLRNAYDAVVLLGPHVDDETSLRAAAPSVGTVVAVTRSGLPRRVRDIVDGVVEPAT